MHRLSDAQGGHRERGHPERTYGEPREPDPRNELLDQPGRGPSPADEEGDDGNRRDDAGRPGGQRRELITQPLELALVYSERGPEVVERRAGDLVEDESDP